MKGVIRILVPAASALWLSAAPACTGESGYRLSEVRESAAVPPVSREEFARLIEELSEPEGYFDTDNFITNETSYLHVIDRLESHTYPGGVYFGVGPGQNFSYIVHTDPELAIIVDIRRQNMLEHLLYKVLMERAGDRMDYLCMLLARDCRGGAGAPDGFPQILAAVARAPSTEARLRTLIGEVESALLADHGLRLTAFDLERIEYVQRSFAASGLDLRFSSFGRSASSYPTFREILLERDLEGRYQSYLSSAELFAELQAFQRENRLIPVVGDFAGDDAMDRVARLLRDNALEISVFYASNVEFYLFDTPEWDRYLANLRRLPFRADAVFVRSYFPTSWPIHPQNVPSHRPTSLVQDVAGLLEDAADGRLGTYWDLVTRRLY